MNINIPPTGLTADYAQTPDTAFDQSIHIPLATNPLSLNLVGGMNRHKKGRLVKQWREFAGWSAKRFPTFTHVDVTLTWFTVIDRVRDEDNLALLLKSLCDGLVDAGVVPDDSPEYMGKQCRIQKAPEGTQVAYMELRVQSLGGEEL